MDGDRPQAFGPDLAAHQDETRRLVRAMMALTGQTASGLARAAGLTPSTLNRFMHKNVGHTLSQRTMLALMAETFTALKARPPQLRDPTALAVLAPAIPLYERAILDLAPDVRPLLAEIKARSGPAAESLADLPVVMAASAGIDVAAGDFTGAPLKTQRPPFLKNDPLAFALLMPDASMAPRFDAGDMLYVSPARALPTAPCDVVIDRGTGFMAATLTAHTATGLRLATLNPRAKHAFDRAKLKGVYPIVGLQRFS